ncbi:MAG: pyrroloquinoline quinone-dependent dehydrogenase [Bryobacterales bacterium]|nr:pyrroloquinoline quinone-dependent dehydrogenase [Bryobacterales bacterium]
MPVHRRDFLKAGAASLVMASAAADTSNWEWRSYAGDNASSRYAPLNQITPSNVRDLEIAWELETLPSGVRPVGMMECTPIVIDGIMYLAGFGLDTYAVDPATGKVLWSNPGLAATARTRAAGVSRGLVHWKDGKDERIFAPVRQHILALDPKSGKLIDSFGSGGGINLRENLDRELAPEMSLYSTTPGVVYQDLLIVTTRPGEGPRSEAPGHIRAYDCRTGKRRWIFHTIPHPGEFGYETWSPNSWKENGGANCWGGMSLDAERGLVYIATGSPTFDFWGGNRKGTNLFGNCVLCLKAETGERVWHFQTVHHDLWDWDLPCAPNLVTVLHNGKPRDAVAQVGKTGWVYLLDRETGEPLYPIEERPVPKSTVPGEESWPTQPFPTNPPPFSRQNFRPEDIAKLSKESHEYLVNTRLKDVVLAPMFTPPMKDKEVVCFPGYHGGGLWGGASWVADKGVLFVNHNELPWSLKLIDAPEGASYPYQHTGYLRPETADGYPAIRPPWGLIAAVDLNNCKILWQTPLGEYKDLTKRGIKPTGTYNRGGNIATSSGLLFSSGTLDGVLRAFDQKDGKLLWEYALGGGGFATPATYMAGGRQFVIMASSPHPAATGKGPKAGFTAFALPK